MRVIGGQFRGRKLLAPKGRAVRPTPDRVREAIFDILGPRWIYTRVLDLFAGTGALGIEALSRGAQEAVFVERAKEAFETIRANLQSLGLVSRATVLPVPIKKGLGILADRKEVFDLILMDPPYGKGLVQNTVHEITRWEILSHDGTIVAEHAPSEAIVHPPALECRLRRNYGDTVISIYRRKPSSP